MSKGRKEEAILTLYLKKYPRIIEELIGISIEQIKIEEKVGGKRIDFYAINRERRIEVFLENQVGPSDKCNHQLEKIIPLINNFSEGYLLWVAEKFQQEHIDGIIKLLQDNPHKYINFYAIEIQPEVKKRIEDLNTCYFLDVWDAMDSINEIEEKFKVVDHHIQMPKTHIGRALIVENPYDFENDYDIKRYLLEKFCQRMPYFFNFHSSKKNLQGNKQLTFGAGIGNVTYFCEIPSKKRKAFVVGIRFEWSFLEVYRHFLEKRELLMQCICPDIYFKDNERTINYCIRTEKSNIDETTDQIAKVLEKFILFFSPYTYGGKIKDILVQPDVETVPDRKLG
ncbi:hypothetical protein HMPREF1012_02312 [Bacillus sp. BT1B_CT2]|uniref:hypothetical protein n=1 Tax=Bacillus TaxID=1386 RepID=UPI0001F4464C|nr:MULTISPECIES: hypothetical protein [Bacillus]EFV71673.1 hypothetical protein HMPREF1012_02312 [Bacillus sp. BT1B_CT2]MEC3835421.1 hypothetical protein [Bacillus licheniformis]